ncbi:tRNA:m(4)x modification enzyme trm13 homolog [Plakobranchus ocellatus]|uniref:tRNA:m(4)X modification enzyme TRM13 n=1 Tax=Plakobranchus ocellatus TaxID=259542 RepID=A0AAV3YG98_9GAST|nr:tRNA:m(4)x modification enzyme trm13 homolog [Plakobranchus ocellatus]
MEDTKVCSKQETKVPGDESITQCKFYLKKKSRLCRFKPKPGQQYCPEHACIMGVPTARKRIPCPLNPKHNCYEDELEKHKRKCNVTKIQEKVAKEVFYVKGVNKGTDECQDCMPVEAQVHLKF